MTSNASFSNVLLQLNGDGDGVFPAPAKKDLEHCSKSFLICHQLAQLGRLSCLLRS